MTFLFCFYWLDDESKGMQIAIVSVRKSGILLQPLKCNNCLKSSFQRIKWVTQTAEITADDEAVKRKGSSPDTLTLFLSFFFLTGLKLATRFYSSPVLLEKTEVRLTKLIPCYKILHNETNYKLIVFKFEGWRSPLNPNAMY